MKSFKFMNKLSVILLMLMLTGSLYAQEEPLQWNENLNRNNVVLAEDLPDHMGDDNRLWHTKLRGRAFFNIITIEGDRVYCGVAANNLPTPERGGGGLVALERDTGKVIWQKTFGDRAAYGLSAVPLITEDRIYVQMGTDLWCLDLNGKTLWEKSIQQPYFSAVHDSHSTGLIIGDYWWVATGYGPGSDDSDNWVWNSLDAPYHPSLMVVHKDTGEIVAKDALIKKHQQHGSWSSISSGVVNGQRQVYYADAHGWLHAFKVPETFEEGKVTTLEEAWWCDVNPKEYRINEDGILLPYSAYMGGFGGKNIGWLEIIGTPAFHEGRIYLTLTRDVHYGTNEGGRWTGHGGVVCIDASGKGDVTETHKVWINKTINRTFSTPSVYKDKVIVATHAGYVHGLNKETGEELWKSDIKVNIWNYWQSVGDDKVFVANEHRDFFIIDANDGKQLFHTELPATNNPQPGLANGILVVGSRRGVTAYGGPEYMKTHEPMEGFEEEEIDPKELENSGH
jgi:outer membrane protein assembly factor BamB